MSRIARKLLRHTSAYASWKALAQYPDYWWWMLRGRPLHPPHRVKQQTVLEYGWRYGLHTLVEAGTYYGEMVQAMLRHFRTIYTVELDPMLVALVRRRFARARHVHVLEGDSQAMIPRILGQLRAPALFWLDAGYYGWEKRMGDHSRLTSELRAILSHSVPGHVILMDDAHGLSGRDGAPTYAELKAGIERDFPGRKVSVSRNIVRITML